MPKSITVGEFFRDARDEADLTQHEVAVSLGVHAQNISNIERGVAMPSWPMVRKLCGLYRKDVRDVPTERANGR